MILLLQNNCWCCHWYQVHYYSDLQGSRFKIAAGFCWKTIITHSVILLFKWITNIEQADGVNFQVASRNILR
uniref:Uncharacterized protein n=1 Tax=Physcomitrium patens TaxID=3218 RepID=A0A2K1LBR9_PHYPA|nr:hypothetical protein PHYPA_001902 [Physcomitrium patens]